MSRPSYLHVSLLFPNVSRATFGRARQPVRDGVPDVDRSVAVARSSGPTIVHNTSSLTRTGRSDNDPAAIYRSITRLSLRCIHPRRCVRTVTLAH